MPNIKLSTGDIAGDMVPTTSSPAGIRTPSVCLPKDRSLYSPSGAFRFTFQTDGNAVVQNVINATLNRKWETGQPLDPANDIQWNPIWATGTNGSGAALNMQDDGNLVVYGDVPSNPAPWNSNTGNNVGAFLRMQDDGNLVIYSNLGVALWNTGTQARKQ